MSKVFLAALAAAVALGVGANNLRITNLSIKGRDARTALVQFDITWENSWRHGNDDAQDPLYLHDAAWVFFKVRRDGSGAEWEHALLAAAGENPEGFVAGEGTAVELVVPEDRVGMFVRRSQEGSGTTAVRRVTAVWDFAANGLAKTDKVLLQAFGLEMCYVAEGAYKLGDGLADRGQFFEFEAEPGDPRKPFEVASAGPIAISNEVGCLWGASTSGNTTIGSAGMLPAEFPNGYGAFYCMKYLITQGQYSDFLNTLTREQQAARCVITTVGNYMSGTAGGHAAAQNRNTIQLAIDDGSSPRVYTNASPDRACNWLSWADVAAFAAWSGLRPMTELEYEKACRGPLEPVAGEYAWGSVNSTPISGLTGKDGSGQEYYTAGNAHWSGNGGPSGPIRVGIFARPGATSREAAGATYWGILDFCDNLRERTVTVGNATGRAFTGLHGDGTLTATSPFGEAAVAGWPGSNATGAGFRGGSWSNAASDARASDRRIAAGTNATRYFNDGGRAARSAP